MTTRQVALIGGAVGLVLSIATLVFLAWGVPAVLLSGDLDWIHVLWPSSRMLVVGWRTTTVGILITLYAVAINCLTYAAMGMGLRVILQSLGGRMKGQSIQ